MKYDTTPLSAQTLGVDLTPPEQELRFAPEDSDVHEHGRIESGEISQPTIIARSIGFDTFIEDRPVTNRLETFKKESLEAPKYRTWALTALLAVISAFGGGFAVYWISADRPGAVNDPSQSISVSPVTEIQPSETFVSKAPADSAAEEPLIPLPPEPPRHQNPANGATSKITDRLPASGDNVAAASENSLPNQPGPPPAHDSIDQAKPEPEREAKVGSYVVEKPAGRKPLARCADGTYSFSASRSAACVGRGGIGEWISDGKPATAAPAKQSAYVLGPRGGCYYLDSSNRKVYVGKKYCEQ